MLFLASLNTEYDIVLPLLIEVVIPYCAGSFRVNSLMINKGAQMGQQDDRQLIYRCDIPVRWGDMDAYGHVNNAMYMRYLEEARVQLLDSMNVGLDPNGLAPVVVDIGCSFIRPVVYPDLLSIQCYSGDLGRSSFMTYYEVFSQQQGGVMVSTGHAKVVWIDHQTQKSVPVPDNVRSLLRL
ncbi:thioesterase family protein [Neptuniibacter pectenicola]|jgi:acyl-CoA thioester hydrolase|uniref:Thioesterase family protein n=1 Tax=Neptuniibacter pectenicola TaxID=1806669 RepID=A0ABU9TSE4_9GAMM